MDRTDQSPGRKKSVAGREYPRKVHYLVEYRKGLCFFPGYGIRPRRISDRSRSIILLVGVYIIEEYAVSSVKLLHGEEVAVGYRDGEGEVVPCLEELKTLGSTTA